MDQKIIHVNIGQIHTGRNGDILKATLGSCVGIAFIWEEKDLCGLAHCLLPESNDDKFSLSAKYVNQAIPALMKLMKITEDSVSKIEVHVGGGSNMLTHLSKSNPEHIGVQNKKMALSILTNLGFKIKHKDFGGEVGRIVTVDCSTKEVKFSFIGEAKGN